MLLSYIFLNNETKLLNVKSKMLKSSGKRTRLLRGFIPECLTESSRITG